MTKKNYPTTPLEILVVATILDSDYFNGVPTLNLVGLKEETSLSVRTLKGVLGSLVKKDVVILGEYPNGEAAYHLVVSTN